MGLRSGRQQRYRNIRVVLLQSEMRKIISSSIIINRTVDPLLHQSEQMNIVGFPAFRGPFPSSHPSRLFLRGCRNPRRKRLDEVDALMRLEHVELFPPILPRLRLYTITEKTTPSRASRNFTSQSPNEPLGHNGARRL